jgi:hypothetical protein
MKLFCSLVIFICYQSVAQNVGISNNNPTHAKLEINGTVGAAVAMFGADRFGVAIEADNPEVGFNYYYNVVQRTIKAGYASVIGMALSTGELYIGNFRASIGATNGNYFNISDRRLKENIEYMDHQQMMDKIMLLKPAVCQMISDPDQSPKNYGFIAQEIEELFPDFVMNTGDIKALCYQYFIPVLAKGMQEQQLQIESLRKENAGIMEELKLLKKQISQKK